MSFNVGDVVRVRESDALRGGEVATIREILPARLSYGSFREYLVEFETQPRNRVARSDRFRLCIYREEQLTSDNDTRA